MTASELKRLLKKAGATFVEGRRHTLATLKGASTTIPRHPSKEIKGKLANKIARDLGTTIEELRKGE